MLAIANGDEKAVTVREYSARTGLSLMTVYRHVQRASGKRQRDEALEEHFSRNLRTRAVSHVGVSGSGPGYVCSASRCLPTLKFRGLPDCRAFQCDRDS